MTTIQNSAFLKRKGKFLPFWYILRDTVELEQMTESPPNIIHYVLNIIQL